MEDQGSYERDATPYIEAVILSLLDGFSHNPNYADRPLSSSDIFRYLDLPSNLATEGLMLSALQACVDDNILEAITDKFGPTYYEYDPNLEKYYKTAKEDKLSILYKLEKIGRNWLISALENCKFYYEKDIDQGQAYEELQILPNGESLQDAAWEPLPVDRTNASYVEMAKEVESAIDTIRSDNGYGDTEPEEKEHILKTLRHGLSSVRENMPSRNEVVVLLLTPLKYLSGKFTGALIGEAAAKAAKAVFEWLSSLL